jgi:hypothetical protein
MHQICAFELGMFNRSDWCHLFDMDDLLAINYLSDITVISDDIYILYIYVHCNLPWFFFVAKQLIFYYNGFSFMFIYIYNNFANFNTTLKTKDTFLKICFHRLKNVWQMYNMVKQPSSLGSVANQPERWNLNIREAHTSLYRSPWWRRLLLNTCIK